MTESNQISRQFTRPYVDGGHRQTSSHAAFHCQSPGSQRSSKDWDHSPSIYLQPNGVQSDPKACCSRRSFRRGAARRADPPLFADEVAELTSVMQLPSRAPRDSTPTSVTMSCSDFFVPLIALISRAVVTYRRIPACHKITKVTTPRKKGLDTEKVPNYGPTSGLCTVSCPGLLRTSIERSPRCSQTQYRPTTAAIHLTRHLPKSADDIRGTADKRSRALCSSIGRRPLTRSSARCS
jgi:hypothetical protein